MDAVTRGDQFIGWGYIVPAVAIFGIVVFAIAAVVDARRNRRAHALMDREFVRTLRSVRQAPPRHRARWQFPNPLELLAAHGKVRKPAGYGPPPPLPSGPEPVVRLSWATADVNTPQFPVNATARASVPSQDPLDAALTVGQVLADTNLRGRVRQPVEMDATQRIEPVRAEVVR